LQSKLSDDHDYWQTQEAFILAKKQEQFNLQKNSHQLLRQIHELIEEQPPTLAPFNCDQSFKDLQEFKALLQQDIESIFLHFSDASELQTNKPALLGQMASNADFFRTEYYAQNLQNILSEIRRQLAEDRHEELARCQAPLLARAHDLKIRASFKAILNNPKIEAFAKLYRTSLSASNHLANYQAQITNFVEQEVEAFTQALYQQAHQPAANELDIAEKIWGKASNRLKQQAFEHLKLAFNHYKQLAEAYAYDQRQTLHQIIDQSFKRATDAHEHYQAKTAIPYREFIQNRGLNSAMTAQLTAWQNYFVGLPLSSSIAELEVFHKMTRRIYKALMQESVNLANSDSFIQARVATQFKAFDEQVSQRIRHYSPISMFSRMNKGWKAFPYKTETLMVSGAIVAVAIFNPALVGASIALGVAAIALSLLILALLRAMTAHHKNQELKTAQSL
jgi:hypothetical protein